MHGISANWLDADYKDVNDLSFSDSETTWGIRGGYMFNRWFGFELGYIDLGNYTGDGGIELDADSWQLAGVGKWNLNDKFALYGKLGAFFINAKSDQVIPVIGSISDDQESNEAYVAVGAEYGFGKVDLFGEFSWVDTKVNDLSIDILTVGLKYNFQIICSVGSRFRAGRPISPARLSLLPGPAPATPISSTDQLL